MREPDWSALRRRTPDWFRDAKLGIFVHWGPYSVPAWAEPIGALGAVDDTTWFTHNAYAEWYHNTMRIEGSPAQHRHRLLYGETPYDDFIDAWHADRFDADAWAALFSEVGADYVIPTTKHHDGVPLWDAPGTGQRNAVQRGPKRDLIGEIASSVRGRGMRFGVYYSGGLDWHISDLPPQRSQADVYGLRPRGAEYNAYALGHLRDLIDRYRPDVLWNDIEWPDAGKHDGPGGLYELFQSFYRHNPDGVVNDRWGVDHQDFRTTEYSFGVAKQESGDAWEHCRGLGWSFGHNRAESSAETLSPQELAMLWADVVARGGRLLLNVGPRADGTIPEEHRQVLEAFGLWKRALGSFAAVTAGSVQPSDPGLRVWRTPTHTVLIADAGVRTWDAGEGAGDAVLEQTDPGVHVQFEKDRRRVVISSERTMPAIVVLRDR